MARLGAARRPEPPVHQRGAPIWASTSSTPPTCIPSARARRCWGRAIRDFARRDQVVIASKVHGVMGSGPNDKGLSRGHIFDAVHASLKRLGTDYLDLYQIHRFDANTPILETMTALHDLVKQGLVRYIGASSMHAYQFAKMQHAADLHGLTRFVSMQNHYTWCTGKRSAR